MLAPRYKLVRGVGEITTVHVSPKETDLINFHDDVCHGSSVDLSRELHTRSWWRLEADSESNLELFRGLPGRKKSLCFLSDFWKVHRSCCRNIIPKGVLFLRNFDSSVLSSDCSDCRGLKRWGVLDRRAQKETVQILSLDNAVVLLLWLCWCLLWVDFRVYEISEFQDYGICCNYVLVSYSGFVTKMKIWPGCWLFRGN